MAGIAPPAAMLSRRVVVRAVLVVVAAALLWRGHPTILPAVALPDVATVAVRLLVAAFVAVAWHEGGHLLVGRIVGFEIPTIILGPVKLWRARRGWRFGWAGRWSLNGGVVCLPRREQHLRRNWALMVAAGPLASLVLALAGPTLRCVALVPLSSYRAVGFGGDFGIGALDAIVVYASLISLLFVLFALVPTDRQGLRSDGAQLWLLLRGGPSAERHLAQVLTIAAARRGVRPREWSPEWMQRLTAVRDGTRHEALAHQTVFYWALDRHDAAAARAALERALALAGKLPPASRAVLFGDAAFFAARVGGDVEAARAYLFAMNSAAPASPINRLRAEAAVALAANDRATAHARATAALRALDALEAAEPVSFPAEREWLAAIRDEAGGDVSGARRVG